MKAAALALVFVLAGCTVGGDEETLGNDESSDYEVAPADGKGDGLAATFNQNDVVGDDLFIGAMSAADLQTFFEKSPYGTRSWLADYTVDGKSAAQAIVDAAAAQGIHPLMLVSRMQVEASIVSKTVRPTQYRIDHALGCGCSDGSSCSTSYRGFSAQLTCGAQTLRKWYDGSVNGDGEWRKGLAKRTLDPRTVTPANHATASLYAYTPWVLVGSGGNWLVWNVTRRYVRHAEDLGLTY